MSAPWSHASREVQLWGGPLDGVVQIVENPPPKVLSFPVAPSVYATGGTDPDGVVRYDTVRYELARVNGRVVYRFRR